MEMRELTVFSVAMRVVVALIIGGIVGLERGMKNRPAGFRTYMLVCVGSALIMLTNQYIFQTTNAGDPTRMSAQVVSGIGFLGAGTIIVTQHNQIKGLTTAAGLWAAAAVGLTIGIGFYEAAVAGGAAIVIILMLLHQWDNRLHMKVRTVDIYFELTKDFSLGNFLRAIRGMNIEILDIRIESTRAIENGICSYIATIKTKRRIVHSEIISEIRGITGVDYCEEI